MKTKFYNRSAYLVVPPVPEFFVELDEVFDRIVPTPLQQFCKKPVMLAENLCRRMGDVEFYAQEIRDTPQEPDDWSGVVKVGSFLVAHFGACKGVLDAISVALNELYTLGLAARNQDMGKGRFWNV